MSETRDIVCVIRGGVLEAVFTDIPNARVVRIDWDVLEFGDEGDPVSVCYEPDGGLSDMGEDARDEYNAAIRAGEWPKMDDERYIPFGTFKLLDDDDAEVAELTFDTWTREVSTGDNGIAVQNAVWFPGDYEEHDDVYWPDDQFDLGQPGIFDDDSGEFKTFDDWEFDRFEYAPEYMAWLERDQQEARDEIKQMLQSEPQPECIYTSLSGVSNDGCRRLIDVCIPVVNRDGRLEIRNITGFVSRALDIPLVDDQGYGLLVSGCGMDMGFDVVYNLAHACGLEEWAQKHKWV